MGILVVDAIRPVTNDLCTQPSTPQPHHAPKEVQSSKLTTRTNQGLRDAIMDCTKLVRHLNNAVTILSQL